VDLVLRLPKPTHLFYIPTKDMFRVQAFYLEDARREILASTALKTLNYAL
jgi:hypothetical protein